jgi:uncharacterized protein YycO
MKNIFFFSPFLFIFSCHPADSKILAEDSMPASQAVQKIQATSIDTNFHNGDIIFQTSNSGQSLAIQLATHSKYSHCGLLFNDNGNWFVYEAVQPVKKTPVREWIERGDNHYFAVERLNNADSVLTASVVSKMRKSADAKLGKNYDLAFDWSDSAFYCSEFVWKVYHESTGLEIGQLKKLKEFDLTSPVVKTQLTKRYGNKIPLEEPMISPGNIFDSELLIKIRG